MKSKLYLTSIVIVLLGCEKPEVHHELSELRLGNGDAASLDIFGRVVVGKRAQLVHFETGIVPIPLVKSGATIFTMDDVRKRSFSEHAGRATGGYLLANASNIASFEFERTRFDDISLTQLDQDRRIRTAVAQFPTLSDFETSGFRGALFTKQETKNTAELGLFRHPSSSSVIAPLELALGRKLSFPVFIDSKSLIENFK